MDKIEMITAKSWLALALILAFLAACAPAETTSDSPTMAPDAAEEMTATTTPTPVPVGAEETDAPASTPTRLTVEIVPETPTKPAPSEQIYPMPGDATAVSPDDPRAQELISKARKDLALHLGIAKEEVVLVEFRYVTWPNSSLGCPAPGVAYTDVLVDGYFIMLRAGLGVYNYHGALDGSPFLCEEIGSKIIVPPPIRSPDQ